MLSCMHMFSLSHTHICTRTHAHASLALQVQEVDSPDPAPGRLGESPPKYPDVPQAQLHCPRPHCVSSWAQLRDPLEKPGTCSLLGLHIQVSHPFLSPSVAQTMDSMAEGGVRREHLHPGTLNSFCLELWAGGNPGEMEPRRTDCDFRGAPAPGPPQGGSWGPALV